MFSVGKTRKNVSRQYVSVCLCVYLGGLDGSDDCGLTFSLKGHHVMVI